MHVCVTGGSGFLGRHLVQELLERGLNVRVVDPVAPPLIESPMLTWVQGSVLDERCLAEAMDGADWVFHIAGYAQLWARYPEAYAINICGTEKVLKLAKRLQTKRVILTSSESILTAAARQRDGHISEDLDLEHASMLGPYTESKRQAFLLAQSAFEKDGVPVSCVFPSVPIGAGDDNRTPPARMIERFLAQKDPAYLECVLNFVSVKDLARGHLLVAEKGISGEHYILGGENATLGEWLKRIEVCSGVKMPKRRVPYGLALGMAYLFEVLGKWTRFEPPASVEGVRLARAGKALDASKAKDELGHEATPVDAALKECVNYLNSPARG